MQNQLDRIEKKLDSHAEKSVERHIEVHAKISKVNNRVTGLETKQKVYIGLAVGIITIITRFIERAL